MKAHVILMIQIESVQTGKAGTPSIALSKLFMADLAGTEKVLGAKGSSIVTKERRLRKEAPSIDHFWL